jgi:hypothetical protein
MFIQVVSTAFLTVLRNIDAWKDRDVIDQPALFGLRRLEAPQELNMDRAAIEKQARDGFRDYREALQAELSPDLFKAFDAMFAEDGVIDINADQWVRTVYDLLAAFRTAADRTHLVESLKGLYFGRALSFMNKTWDWSTEEAEKEILAQAEQFHAERKYLIRKLEA